MILKIKSIEKSSNYDLFVVRKSEISEPTLTFNLSVKFAMSLEYFTIHCKLLNNESF